MYEYEIPFYRAVRQTQTSAETQRRHFPHSQIWLLFVWMFSAGGFPTQVVICDLRGVRMTRAIVLSERHDMWDCAPSTLSDYGAATVHALSSQHD